MFAMLTALALAVPGGAPPVITYFYAAVTPENVLYVDGTVEDDGDLTKANAFIYWYGGFWDIPLDEWGYFHWSEQLSSGQSGFVVCEVADEEWHLSEQVEQFVEAWI